MKLYRKNIFCITGVITIFAISSMLLINILSSSKADDDYWKKIKNNYSIYAPPLPDSVDFAGEKMPIERYDVRRALDYEILKIMYWHSETLLYIKRQNAFFPVVEPILKKYHIPDDFKYLLVAESGMTERVSPVGAAGYWQFLKKTAQQYGLRVDKYVDERYDLKKSTVAACKYLQDAYKTFGSWTLAAASYNAGTNGINSQLIRQKQKSFYDLLLNRETARYIYRIVAFKLILSNPKKYGFYVRKKEMYKMPKTYTIETNKDINSLIDFAIEHHTTYRIVKLLNPWLRSDNLITNGKYYKIKLPKNKK